MFRPGPNQNVLPILDSNKARLERGSLASTFDLTLIGILAHSIWGLSSVLQVTDKVHNAKRVISPKDSEACSWLALTALLLVAVVLTRASALGNPLYSADDQLYLQFGQAIDHGQIPYVDIWDRKPIGLFFVYAAIGLLPGNPVVIYQLIAGLFVLGTALIIYRIARLYSGEWGSRATALAFIISLPMFKGAAGQAQIFYEPIIALTALLVIAPHTAGGRGRALCAMLLCGIAFTIKQTVIVEAAFFGFWLVVARWRQAGATEAMSRAVILAFMFAVPTLLTFAGMAAIDQLPTYLDSSFLSIFHKGSEAHSASFARVIACALLLAPLSGFALWGHLIRRRQQSHPLEFERFILFWALAALGGVALIPRFYAYYPIPLLLPLSIAASSVFERVRTGPLFLLCLAGLTLMHGDVLRFDDTRAARTGFNALVADIRANANGGCLFVADGPGLLYGASGVGCRTPYRFPEHLSLATEAGSIGGDPAKAVRDVLAQRPTVIVLRLGQADEQRNPRTWPIIRDALAANYHLLRRYRLPVEYIPQTLSVWVLNSDRRADRGLVD